jgi:glycosyltransferase involved in cell wall biosynthesis
MKVVFFMDSECDGLVDGDFDAELLVKFSNQGLGGALSSVDFPSRKLPQAAHVTALGPLGQQYPAIDVTDHGCGDGQLAGGVLTFFHGRNRIRARWFGSNGPGRNMNLVRCAGWRYTRTRTMKLVIQIPAWNEEASLPDTLAALPSEIEGVDEIEFLVIDDGSTDRTMEVASRAGARVVRMPVHRGLAVAFTTGLRSAVRSGADIVVNTDADNQYDARDISVLVAPILDGSAQMVIGDRQVASLPHFSATKRLLQKLGSWVVRRLSGTTVQDATSGFRAISREAALRLHVFTRFTYTLETILQAGEAGLRVVSVPVRINPGEGRPSRLFKSDFGYVLRSLASMARIVTLYNPLRIFLMLGAVPIVVGFALLLRFLYFYLTDISPAGHVQSLILAVILIVIGSLVWLAGVMADLTAVNRRLLEELVESQREQYLEGRR